MNENPSSQDHDAYSDDNACYVEMHAQDPKSRSWYAGGIDQFFVTYDELVKFVYTGETFTIPDGLCNYDNVEQRTTMLLSRLQP